MRKTYSFRPKNAPPLTVKALEAQEANFNSENLRLQRKIQNLESEVKKLYSKQYSLIETEKSEKERSVALDNKIVEIQQETENICAEISHIYDEKSEVEMYVTTTSKYQRLQKDYLKARAFAKENKTATNIRTSSLTLKPNKRNLPPLIQEKDQDKPIIDKKIAKTYEIKRKQTNYKDTVVLHKERTFSFEKPADVNTLNVITAYNGSITWETILSECNRITSDIDLNLYNLVPYYNPLPDTVANVRSNLLEIEESKYSLIESRKEINKTKVHINEVTERLRSARVQLESEENNAEQETIKESELKMEIELLDTQIASKGKEIMRIQKAIASTNKNLSKQLLLKNDLQHNLSDLVLKEKPEIAKLSDDVESWRMSLKDISERLEATTEEIATKKERIEEMESNPTIRELFRIKDKKQRILKSIASLKNDIKKEDTPRDDYQQVYDKNMIKIENLNNQLGKIERQKKEEEVAVRDLANYSDYITNYLREKKKIE